MENNIRKAKEKIMLRREQLAFDKLSEEEKRNRRIQGLDPYESKEVRAKKKAAYREERKRRFDKLPKDARAALTRIGLSPYQDEDTIIYRDCGPFKAIQ